MGRKVRLNATQVKFAKDNGIKLEDYAKAQLPKRGRPVGSKNKPKVSDFQKTLNEWDRMDAKSAAKSNIEKMLTANYVQNTRDRLRKAFAFPDQSKLQDIIDEKDVQILNLKHEIVGYKAVISYLEHQLGLGKSQ